MFYRRQWRFPCGINALVFKRYKGDNYHIWFDDLTNENRFETYCTGDNLLVLYHVLYSGLEHLKTIRKPLLKT